MFRIPRLAALLLLASSAAFAALKPGDFVTSGPTTSKRIALTFDDGPGPQTQAYIDLLDRYNAKATFFMLGEQTHFRPAIAKQIAEKGHEIANHTFNHTNYLQRYRTNLKKLGDAPDAKEKAAVQTRQELTADMKKSRKIIEDATGAKLVFLRMPHGIDRPWVKEAAKEADFVLVNWTYGGDWLKTPEGILEKDYLQAIKPGAIFLLHDGGSHREKSLQITEALLKTAKERGYEIVLISDLLNQKP